MPARYTSRLKKHVAGTKYTPRELTEANGKLYITSDDGSTDTELYTNVSSADEADKLSTPRKIGLSGVTATAQDFDGTSNITIPVTDVPASVVSGLADVATSGDYGDLENTPDIPEAATTAPKVAGTAAVGTSVKYAREDHVHPVQTSVSGNAGTATKFQNAQSVTLTGDVTGTASSQAGWSVATTLADSGVTAGSYGPAENATPNAGETFNVPYVTYDSKGRATGAATKTVTIPKERYGVVASGSTDTAYSVTVNNLDDLYDGAIIYVYNNVVANKASATLNVNSKGAKPIYYQNAVIPASRWPLGSLGIFVYNTSIVSTGCWVMSYSYGQNSTYSNPALGQGYATCTTNVAAATATLSSYALAVGGIVSVKFANALPANATLNINSKGAKNVFYNGARIIAGIVNAGDIATFIYDGTQYQLISVDKITVTSSGSGNLVTGVTVTGANTINIEKNSTLPVATSAAPKAAGTASAGTSADFARADHVHPVQTSVSGNAGTATKLAKTVTIGLSGVTATAQNFDGSGNVTIPVTDVPAAVVSGLADVATSGAYGDLSGIPDIPVASDDNPLVAGTAAPGESAEYARADHVHPVQTSVSGNAGTATKLASAVNIGLSGVTSTAQSFDGSKTITIPITAVPSSIVTGLADVATSGAYGDLSGTPDIPVAAGIAPKAAGTATVGTSAKYAREDHVHPVQTSVSGNAGTATKLANTVTIGLSGVTATAQNFDGSGNVTIPVTAVPSSIVTGLADVATSGDYADLDNTPTIPVATSATPKAAGTASAGTSADFARADHVHPVQTSVSGNAGTATKLASTVTIGLSGVTATAQNFDGSGNVTIPVTDVPASVVSGLADVATSGSYNDLDDKPTIPGAPTVAPKAAGTAAIGTSTKYAKEDHVHPLQTSVSGNAGTATKLASTVTIGLSGVTATAQDFDGSGNITIPVTAVPSSIVTGLADVATSGDYADLTGTPDIPEAATVTPKAAGTAAVGTSVKYAKEDHVHPLQTSVSGNAGTATKFASAQSVTLTGDVTGTASSQAGWSVATTLADSGVTAGSYGPDKNATAAHGGTITVPEITVDDKGRATSAANRTITLPTETQLSKGADTTGTAKTLTFGGTFTAVTDTAVSNHTVTDENTTFTMPSETQLSKGSTTGSGNAVTDISVSNHKITLTKGVTFATKEEFDNLVTRLGNPMIFRGTLGTGGTITTLPTASASNAGDTYKVITAGTYASIAAKVGDTFTCFQDKSDSTYKWGYIPSGDEPSGTVTNVATGSGLTGGPITSSGTISHADTSSQESLVASGRRYVTGVTLDDFGHVTGLTTGTETITNYQSNSVVTNSATGKSNTTTPLTNGNVFLNHIENNAVRNSHKITGAGATTVTSDKDGNIVISSVNSEYAGNTGSTSITPKGEVTSTFTGTTATISASYKPAGTIAVTPTVTLNTSNALTGVSAALAAAPSFTGTKATLTHTVTQGSVSVSKSYQPAGSVSKPNVTVTKTTTSALSGVSAALDDAPTFTGTTATLTLTGSTSGVAVGAHTYQPAGTVSKPNVTVTPTTTSALTGVTAALSATPSFTGTKATLTHTVTQGSVSVSGSYKPAGTVSKPDVTITPTTASALTGVSAALSAAPSFTGTTATITVSGSTSGVAVGAHTYTPAGDVSKPTFSGTLATLTHTVTQGSVSASTSYQPKGSVSKPNVTVTKTTTSALSGVSAALASAPSFTGTKATLSLSGSTSGVAVSDISYQPAGTVSKPGFTGTKATLTHTVTQGSVSASTNYQPAGTISKPNVTVTPTTTSVLTGVSAALSATPSFTGTTATLTLTGSTSGVAVGAHTYQPAGTVSKPAFTGTKATLTHTVTQGSVSASASYQPAGTVSKPNVTITPTTTSVYSITGVGSVPTRESFTYHTLSVVGNGLVATANSAYSITGVGSVPTRSASAITVMTGASAALASTPTFTGTTATINVSGSTSGVAVADHVYTPAGALAEAPVFTGTTATIGHSVTQGSVSVSGEYKPAGSVSKPNVTITPTTTSALTGVTAALAATPAFTGTTATITVSGSTSGVAVDDHVYTPAGALNAAPTFTGTTATLKHTVTQGSVSVSGEYTPAGSVSKPNVSVTPSTVTVLSDASAALAATPTFTGTTATITVSGTTTGVAVDDIEFTPAGDVSKPSFTGTKATLTHSVTQGSVSASGEYQPAGSVSKPNVNVTPTTTSVLTGATAALAATPTFSGTTVTLTLTGSTSGVSVDDIVYTPAGSVSKPNVSVTPTTTSVLSGVSAALAAAPTFTGTTATINHSVTQGSVSVSGEYKPAGSVSKPDVSVTPTTVTVLSDASAALAATPTFTGTTVTLTLTGSTSGVAVADIEYTPEGSVSKPNVSVTPTTAAFATGVKSATATGSFTGTTATISTTYQPAGTVSSTFTGTAESHSHTINSAD